MKLPLTLLLAALALVPALSQKIDIEFDDSAVFESYKTIHIVQCPINANGG